MKVYKFGGASVKDAQGFKNAASIVQNHSANGELLIIISAIGKTTNMLEAVWQDAVHKRSYTDNLNRVIDNHLNIARDLFTNSTHLVFQQLDQLFIKLEKVLQKDTYDHPDYLYDQTVSFGELLSTTIMTAFLNESEVQSKLIFAKYYIQTNDQWREGQVDWEYSEAIIQTNLTPILRKYVVVTQGFIGGTIDNHTTTLGRDGSDYSAAIFGACLLAESVTIWKDVEGVLSADPRRIEGGKLFERIPYRDAAEMTYYGANVVHPKTIRPLALKKIPLYVKPFLQPEKPGTCIGNFTAEKLHPAMIFKANQSLITLQPRDFTNVSQSALGRLFQELSRLSIKINVVANSALTFSVCADTHKEKLEELQRLFKKYYQIEIRHGLELITIKNFTNEAVDQFRSLPNIVLVHRTVANYQIVHQPEHEVEYDPKTQAV